MKNSHIALKIEKKHVLENLVLSQNETGSKTCFFSIFTQKHFAHGVRNVMDIKSTKHLHKSGAFPNVQPFRKKCIKTPLYGDFLEKLLLTHIEQFGYFIFDLSKFNPKFVKIEVIGGTITVNFDKFALKSLNSNLKHPNCSMWVLRKWER